MVLFDPRFNIIPYAIETHIWPHSEWCRDWCSGGLIRSTKSIYTTFVYMRTSSIHEIQYNTLDGRERQIPNLLSDERENVINLLATLLQLWNHFCQIQCWSLFKCKISSANVNFSASMTFNAAHISIRILFWLMLLLLFRPFKTCFTLEWT